MDIKEKPSSEIWIVADLLLDAVVQLDETGSLQPTSGHHSYATVGLHPGGGAFHASIGALESGFRPVNIITTLGKFGKASSSAVVELFKSVLSYDGLELHVDIEDRVLAPTIIIHKGNNSRLLFSRASPYRLSETFIRKALKPYKGTDQSFFFMSGYTLFDPVRTNTAQWALKYAHDLGLRTVIDVVPHRIYTQITLDDFERVTALGDILISDLSTLVRIYDLDHSALDVVEHIQSKADFIAFDTDTYIIRRSGKKLMVGTRPIIEVPSRGFTDRFAMYLLFEHFLED